jgi:glycosyltransferase involved in cell wall biosynthesis
VRIQFVVNTTGLTGGIRVVFEHANRLQDRGHEVTIVHALDLNSNRGLGSRARTLAKRLKFALRPEVAWFDVRVPIRRVPRAENRWMRDADAVIATANETAAWVAGLEPRCGTKFYFIQHDEVWTRDPAAVRATWALPLHRIVIATWLQELGDRLGAPAIAMVTNGVNLDEFHGELHPLRSPPRILLMVHPQPWKGTDDALSALEALRAAGVRFELTCFGAHGFSARERRLGRTVDRPVGESLRRLYCDHDLFVSPSWTEGCQLPPMEAMACGCAVVATNVGGIPDYAIAGVTALVVEPRDPLALAGAVRTLLESPQRLQEVAAAGQRHIRTFTWERATARLEAALEAHVET